MRDEGVIKFECRRKDAAPLNPEILGPLLRCRRLLYERGLIGCYPDGIGFGNISLRGAQEKHFIISASQTGALAEADGRHFVKVTDYSIEGNWVACEGPAEASSESLTHALIYEVFPDAAAVIHVHHAEAWQRLQLEGKLPVTRKDVPYGTPEMAAEMRRLAFESDLAKERILVMAGHEDGIIAFGARLPEAYERLISLISF